MRKTLMFLISMFLVMSMLSGCIIDPWWWEHGGRGGGHSEHR
jgi:hypothetical protein